MRKILRFLSLLTALCGVALWFATGSNRGWTKTTETTMVLDEITGIEGPVTVDNFSAGVDFLAICALVAFTLLVVSFFVKGQPRYS